MKLLQPDLDEKLLEILGLSSIYGTTRPAAANHCTGPGLSRGSRAMMKMAMSQAASALLRALIARSGAPRDRILLIDVQSVDWRSLTFTGERHSIDLRVSPPHSQAIIDRMCSGLEDAEFTIPGIIVADIGLAGSPVASADGSITISIEALTVADD
jgi:hypothetical protein